MGLIQTCQNITSRKTHAKFSLTFERNYRPAGGSEENSLTAATSCNFCLPWRGDFGITQDKRIGWVNCTNTLSPYFCFNSRNIMKLHLPTRLRAAVLACFAVMTSFTTTLATGAITGGLFAVSAAAVGALTIGQHAQALTATTVAGIDTSSDYSSNGVTYSADTGVLSGAGLADDITFDLKYGSLQNSQWFIYTTNSSGVCWGYGTTADGDVRGYWRATQTSELGVWDNASNPTVLMENISALAVGDSETVQLTAELSGKGTALAAGGLVSVGIPGNLHSCGSLHAGSTTPENTTIDKSVITRLYVVDSTGTCTRYTSGNFGVVLEEGQHVNATTGRVVLNGGTSGSAATTSATGNPIFVGGAGQLFLQAWGQGPVNLNNDLYLGSSTYSDVATYGVVRLGNDGGASNTITLNGTITVLEDTSIKGNGGDPVYITGTVTDKKYINGMASAGGKTLSVGGSGYTMSGRVDVSNVVLLAGSGVEFSGEVAVGDLTMQGNSSATFSGSNANLETLTTSAESMLTVKQGGSLTLGGTVTLGSSIVNNGTLSFATDIRLDISGLSESGGVYTIFTGNEVADFAHLSAENITGIATNGREWEFHANGTITASVTEGTCFYSGGTLSWDTTSPSFDDGATFAAGGSVYFSGVSSVTLAENISAEIVEVREDATVSLSGGSNKLTAADLQLKGNLILKDNALASAGRVSGAGTLTIDGAVSFDNVQTLAAYTGNLIVDSGAVLKAGASDGSGNGCFGVNYVNNTSRSITVKQGGTLDVNGQADVYYAVVLESGARLTNTGNAVGAGSKGLPKITLNGDALITSNAEFGMVGSGYVDTALNLNGHTLTKEGTGTFNLINTNTDAGIISVRGGMLKVQTQSGNGGSYNGTIFDIGSGATLTIEGNGNVFTNAQININTTKLVQSTGATLGATVTIGNGASFQANGGTYTGTHLVLKDGGTFLYRTGGDHSFASLNTGTSTISLADGAARVMTVTGASESTGLLTTTNNGKLVYSSAVTLHKGIRVQGGTVTFNGVTSIAGTLTVAEGATLNVGESGSVVIVGLGGFSAAVEEPTVNGIAKVNYRILDNSGTSNISSVTYNGTAHTLTDGCLSVDGLYYVVSDTVTTGGSSPSSDTESAAGFVVKSGAVLNVVGNASETLDVHRILTTTSGSGTLQLSSSTTLKDGAATVFTGDLEIAAGGRLSLGSDLTTGSTSAQTASIASLNSTVLNGGTLFVRGIQGNLGTIVSKSDSVLQIFDMAGSNGVASGTLSMDALQLNANLELKINWKNNINIDLLTGAGNLAAQHYFQTGNGDRDNCGENLNLYIDSLSGYSGTISMIGGDKGLEAPVNMRVSTGTQAVNMGGIAITNSTLDLNIESATSMAAGLNITGWAYNGDRGSTVNVAVANGGSFTGAVNVSGAGNSLTSTAGGMNLSQLNVAAGAALDLNGFVSALLMNQAGSVDIADLLLTDGAVLTYGDAANLLQVTDSMLTGSVVIGSGLTLTDSGVNLGLSTTITQDRIGISNYGDAVLESVNGNWHLKSGIPENVLVVGSEGVDYDSADVTGKNTIRLDGGELTLGDTDVASAYTTLTATAEGGSIIAGGTEAEVSFNTVTIADNATVTLKDGATDLTVKANTLNLGSGSAIVLEAGQVLDLSSVDNMDDEDTGKFSKLLNATSGAGTLKVSMPGEFRMKTDTNLSTHLETAQLKINSWGSGGKSLIIGENGRLTLTGRLILQSTAKTVVSGGIVETDMIELGHSQAGNPGHFVLNSGTVTTGGFVHHNSANTLTMSGGTLEITTGSGINNGIATTITGGTLVANTADWGVSGATVGGVTVQGGNTITLTDASLTGVITNAAGKLALAGTVNVLSTGYTAGTVDGWSASGNGYQSQYAQYTLTSTAENLTASGVTAWQVDGSSDGVSYEDGVVKVLGSQDMTTYWVNTGTVQYSDTDTAFDAATTTLKLNGNAADGVDTLQLNTALRDGVSIVAVSGSSTALNLNGADVVLDASQLGEGVSASTVTLTGNGKYTQAASGNALSLKVGGVTDAANWTGTVSISGNITNINLNSYGNANSSVELSGVSGYWQGKKTVFNTNVILTNPSNGTPAVKVTNANSGAEITFAGSVSGTGDIYRNTDAGGTQTYIFAGDVSDWSGTFKNNWTESATIVKFTGSSEVNANFDRGIGNGNKLYNLQLIVDDSNMDTPTTVVMNGSITATSLTVTEGTTAKINGALALDGALTTNGVTQLAGDAANGTVLGQIAGTGALEILQGDVTVNRKTDFSSGTLKLAAGSTLNLDLTTLGVTDLKNWSDAPLLTLGTLDTLTTGGKLNLDAQVGSSALLTLGNGDTKVLASITNCTAELESLLLNGGSSVKLPGVDGMEYKYELVQNSGDGVVNVLISAANVQEGWVAEDSDPDSLADTTWTNSDVSGDGKWSGAVGEFYGLGSADVNVDEAGVTTEKVIVSAVVGVTEYTFTGGELSTGMMAVNKGGLVLDNAGAAVSQVVILSNSATLTVEDGKTLTVGNELSSDDPLDPGMSMGAGMAVSGEATLVNKGTTTVNGTLSVGDAATVNNSGTLDADTLDASGATITNTGTLISGGGIIGTLSGEGTLQNSGVLSIASDTTLSSLSNSGLLTVDGQLKVLGDVTSGGTVTVTKDASLGTLTNTGTLTVGGKLTVTGIVTEGGTVTAASADLKDAAFDKLTVTGAATAGALTVTEAAVGSLTADSLTGVGTVTVGNNATLGTLTNTGSLTVGSKLTVTGDVTEGGTVTAASAELSNANFASLTVTDTVSAGKLSVGTLETGALAVDSLIITDGDALVKSDTTLNEFENQGAGTVTIKGNLTVNSGVTQGGAVVADNVTVNGAADFTSVTTDTLSADAVALESGQITTLTTDDLTLKNGGKVSVTNNVTLSGLTGDGTLDVEQKLTLTDTVTSSVNVETKQIELRAEGSTLGDVVTNTIIMEEGLLLHETDALLTVNGISSLSSEVIGIDVSQSAVDAFVRDESGGYAAADYLIIDGVQDGAVFMNTNAEQMQEIRRTGMNAQMLVADGSLSLSISRLTDTAGNEVEMTWDTSGGNTLTNSGYEIVSDGDAFYRSLDYVRNVIVGDECTFDLSADAVGDSVKGNASEPLAGLPVRNLSGGGNLIIKGNGASQDTATLLRTAGRTVNAEDAVSVTADAATVNLGLPEGCPGVLSDDVDTEAPVLSNLYLRNRARVNVNGSTEVLGDTELDDFTRLIVAEGNTLTTSALLGTEESEIKGNIVVSKSGNYIGTYNEAFITAGSGSKLSLRTGSRSGLALQALAGSSVTLDSNGEAGSMQYLRVGDSPLARTAGAGTTLTLLNTGETENGIEYSTLTVTDTTGNYINNTAVTFSLGVAETARTLGSSLVPVVIDGTVDVTNCSITVNMLGNTVKDGVLQVRSDVDKDLSLAVLVTDGEFSNNTVTLTAAPELLEVLSKYYTNIRLDGGGVIRVDRVTDFYSSRLTVSENAQVGIDMADKALVKVNPQAFREEYKDLAGVLDSLDAYAASGDNAAADELGAAVSGSSIAALGAALAGDVERQLMSIRNRTTIMGVDQTQVNENMPYFNAWINAEGDYRTLDQDGMASGYDLSSWGGTVGCDVDMTPRFTLGLAATAMYGDFTSKSADKAEGDLDTYYVTAFARYAAHRWSHTFVATVGMGSASLQRTVTHDNGYYTAEGDADATTFGFLYEVGYVMAMNESATACLQPVFNVMLSHSTLDGYSEENSDAGLTTSGVDMTTVTFGMGARAQAIVGTNLYNRSSMVEARALVKVHAGDRGAEAENSLNAVPSSMGSVTAAEKGVIGAELGVGLTVPMGATGGSVFADASVEVGGGYTNVNGTVGYRINF